MPSPDFTYFVNPSRSSFLSSVAALPIALSDHLPPTAGAQNTLPIWILGKIRLGQQLPEVNAVVFVVILMTVIPVVISQRLAQESGLLRRR